MERGKAINAKNAGPVHGSRKFRKFPASLKPGWYEVPPTARRHLAKPLCRGEPEA